MLIFYSFSSLTEDIVKLNGITGIAEAETLPESSGGTISAGGPRTGALFHPPTPNAPRRVPLLMAARSDLGFGSEHGWAVREQDQL
jgi:hypothetical protein